MKKRLMVFIIALMSVSLIGIVAMQLLWIKNAIEVNEALFDRSVNDALNNVVLKIEKREAAVHILGKIEHFDSIQLRDVLRYDDSVGTELTKKTTIKTTQINDSIKQIIEVSNDGGRVEHKIEVIKESDNQVTVNKKHISKKIETDTKNFVLVSKNNLVIKRDSQNIVKRDVVKFRNIVNQMVIEFISDSTPIENRLNVIKLDSLLCAEFQIKGILQGYEYAIYEQKGDSVLPYKSKGFNKNFITTKYKTHLFPNDLISKPFLLLVHFPKKNNHLLRSLSLLLFGSLLFTSVIIVTFALTIQVILRQKKISEIKSDFINNMTHEFKTPIATISVAIDSILNPKVLESKHRLIYFAGKIKEENSRMNSLVEQVLQAALLERGDFKLDIQPIDIHELLTDILGCFILQIEKYAGMLTTDFCAEQSIVMADRIHMTNVIYNLLDNGIKYCQQVPVIAISTEKQNKHLTISVKDNGIGMTKEVLDNIFDKFYRKTNGNVHNIKGFGLGLSYVKAIVNAHNAAITVKSEPEKGSEFCITIPLVQE